LPEGPLATADLARWEALSVTDLEEELESRGIWDGLPMANFDRRKVAAMLEALPAARGGAVAVPPLAAAVDVEVVAAVAVLAGCDDRHMPVLLAALRALSEPELNALGVLTTTGNAALMVLVSGSGAMKRGYSGGANCLGPGSRSNAVTGRALSLVCRGLGGAREGVADMSTMGQPAKFGLCFAENETASPWPPYNPGDSVTLAAISGVVEVVNVDAPAIAVLDTFASVIAAPSVVVPSSWSHEIRSHAFALVSPETAAGLAAAGLSRSGVEAEILARTSDRRSGWGVERVHVVVAGGVGVKQTLLPGWPASAPATMPL
jgi:hypothetical protein